jgi:hypothetical protein
LESCSNSSLVSPCDQFDTFFAGADGLAADLSPSSIIWATFHQHQDPSSIHPFGPASLLDTSSSTVLGSISPPKKPICSPEMTVSPLSLHEKPNLLLGTTIPPPKKPVLLPKAPVLSQRERFCKESGYLQDRYLQQAASLSLFSLLTWSIKCPNSSCAKVYKNQAGLNWHLEKGVCDPQPSKILQLARNLVEQKKEERKYKPADTTEMTLLKLHVQSGFCSMRAKIAVKHGITENDVHDIEKQLVMQGRPWACGVETCTCCYKELNGLCVHWQKSGEHGKKGFALFRSGQHEAINQMREDGWDV